MIAGAMATALVLLLAYHGITVNNLVPEGNPNTLSAQTQARLEDLVFKPHSAPVVAAGSSLLYGVVEQEPGRDKILNLCLPGCSAVDAIATMEMTHKYPAILLVEMSNRLLVPPLRSIDEMFSPYRQKLLSASPMLRQGYQPTRVLLNILMPGPDNIPDLSDPRASIIRAGYRSLNFERRDKSLSAEEKRILTKNLTTLKSMLKTIAKSGTKVVLLRMPPDKGLIGHQFENEVEQLMSEYFPTSEYEWITSDKKDWDTLDGMHLTTTDAASLKTELLKKLRI